MRYWWVNQNQTFRQEIDGGYLWSPKRNANGARNPFYESMREVSPGDLIFSFVDTRIVALGIAKSYCWECPKPAEFGSTGEYWENIGWRVTVSFSTLLHRVRPKDHMAILTSLLPSRYSPLQLNGNGNQALYLTEIPQDFAEVLVGLIGEEARALLSKPVEAAPLEGNPMIPGDDLGTC
jgi:putative restriction endonuclease